MTFGPHGDADRGLAPHGDQSSVFRFLERLTVTLAQSLERALAGIVLLALFGVRGGIVLLRMISIATLSAGVMSRSRRAGVKPSRPNTDSAFEPPPSCSFL
jgi:hypothetical protein